jgi:hypothetical protein
MCLTERQRIRTATKSKMMDKWLKNTKPGDKGLTRPPVSVCISVHKNEVRSIDRQVGKEGIRLIRMRQGVSSGSDEQVGSYSQSTVTHTNTEKDEMEDVVDEEQNVDHEEEDVRDDFKEEEEEDVLDEKEEKETEDDDDEDGEKVEKEVLEKGEEEKEESDVVLSKHSVWLGM